MLSTIPHIGPRYSRMTAGRRCQIHSIKMPWAAFWLRYSQGASYTSWARRIGAMLLVVALTGCGVLDRPLWRPPGAENTKGFVQSSPLSAADQYKALRAGNPGIAPIRLPDPELPLNAEVQREIRRYQKSERFLEAALVRREAYYPLMKQIFDDEGVPEALINLALIESAYNPDAKSHAGAVGLWQFMKATAREYGLTVTKQEDQRRDPILSSIAAARHLRDLYSIFQDWSLALAAYNAGVGGVTRALIRTRTDNFWSLARKKKGIKKETKDYVPRFIAATLILNDLNGHGLGWLAERFSNSGVREGPQQALQGSTLLGEGLQNGTAANWAGDRRPPVG